MIYLLRSHRLWYSPVGIGTHPKLPADAKEKREKYPGSYLSTPPLPPGQPLGQAWLEDRQGTWRSTGCRGWGSEIISRTYERKETHFPANDKASGALPLHPTATALSHVNGDESRTSCLIFSHCMFWDSTYTKLKFNTHLLLKFNVQYHLNIFFMFQNTLETLFRLQIPPCSFLIRTSD